jgi:3-beta hydroxysteroid dehydrogenase/isomerase family
MTAGIGASSSLMGPSALTDYTHRDNLSYAVIKAMEALESDDKQKRSSVAGRAYFVTDGWPCHTIEGFSPLLEALGYGSPYDCAVASISSGSTGPVASYLSKQPHLWRQAYECGAARIPLSVLNESVKSGESVKVSPEWAANLQGGGAAAAAVEAAPASVKKRQRSASPSARGSKKAAAPFVPAATTITSASHSADRREILVTAEAALPKRVPVPDVCVQLGAVVMEGLASTVKLLTLGKVRPEPFLTLADTRKVLRHNYFVSHSAMRDLGYKPVTQPVEGLREMVRYYLNAGYSGVVQTPPLVAWVTVIVGLAFNALVGYNYRGILSQSVATALPIIKSSASLAGLAGSLLASSPAKLTASAGWLVRVIFWAAILCHLIQGAWAFLYALKNKRNALAYGFNSAVVGFGATQLLVGDVNRSKGGSSSSVPLLCISLFVACVPVVAALDLALGGRL